MRIHELGHIVLYVSDLSRSAHFYKDILGFKEIDRSKNTALFSSGRNHHELFLIEIRGTTPVKGYPKPGLYHIGFKIGNTDRELKEAMNEIKEQKITIQGLTNHHVTHSLYILDPDNNEIELYIDVDDSWKENPLKILNRPGRLEL